MNGLVLLVILFLLCLVVAAFGFYCHFYQDYNRWLGDGGEQVKCHGATDGVTTKFHGHHSPALGPWKGKDGGSKNNYIISSDSRGDDGLGNYDHADKFSLLVTGQAYHENSVARNDPTIAVLF